MAMIEHRKKSASVDMGKYNNDDVEPHDSKKSIYRLSSGYALSGIFALVFMYYICQIDIRAALSSHSAYQTQSQKRFSLPPLESTAKPTIEAVLPVVRNKNEHITAHEHISVTQTPKIDIAKSLPATPVTPMPHSSALRLVATQPDAKEKELLQAVNTQLSKIRHMKFDEHVVIEKSEEAQAQIKILQTQLRMLMLEQYGAPPYVVDMKIRFPDSMTSETLPQEQTIVIEMGPIDLVPYSVYYFLEEVRNFKGGAFHRNAGHVLQAQVANRKLQSLAFQEYNPGFPHNIYTMGYAGRPGGPAFYISTMDNVRNHGPASQGSKTEADSCFGKIINGIDVVQRMKTQPGGSKGSGFVGNSANHIKILSLALRR